MFRLNSFISPAVLLRLYRSFLFRRKNFELRLKPNAQFWCWARPLDALIESSEALGSETIDMVRRDPCSKPLSAKSRSRAEEAQQDGTLILLERILRCECGARVGARSSPAGELVPTRHIPREVTLSGLPAERRVCAEKQVNIPRTDVR